MIHYCAIIITDFFINVSRNDSICDYYINEQSEQI